MGDDDNLECRATGGNGGEWSGLALIVVIVIYAVGYGLYLCLA
jgi:hypothetical protein